MRVPIAKLLILGALASSGCARSDFDKLCNAEERSGAAAIRDPAERASETARWIQANLHSASAKQTFAALGAVDPAAKAAILVEAAREAGYTGPCPMADRLRSLAR